MKPKIATQEMIDAARERYARGSNDDIEIDDDAKVSPAEGGVWVNAWVWLPDDEEVAQ